MNCIQSLINICIYIKETNWNYYYKYICICKRNIFQNEIPLCYIALLDCHIWSIFVRRFIEPLFYRFEYRFLFGKLLNEIGWIQWNLFIGIPNSTCVYINLWLFPAFVLRNRSKFEVVTRNLKRQKVWAVWYFLALNIWPSLIFQEEKLSFWFIEKSIVNVKIKTE